MTRQLLLIVAVVFGALAVPPASAQDAASELMPYAPTDAGQLIALSPDGSMVAGMQRDTGAFCTFTVPSGETIACADLKERSIRVQRSEVRWSPDNQLIVFAEPAFETGRDGDLWLFGARTGHLTNLTGEGDVGDFQIIDRAGQTADVYIDIAPAWSPDGSTIAFSRTTFPVGSDNWPSDLMLLDLATGEVTPLLRVDPARFGVLSGGLMGWSPDGGTIYATAWFTFDDPRNGVWAFDVASGTGAQLVGGLNVPDFTGSVALIDISPAGDWLGIVDQRMLEMSRRGEAEQLNTSGLALFSLMDASVSTIQAPADVIGSGFLITGPSFTPDGSTIIYGAFDPHQNTGYVIARAISTGEQSVLARLTGETLVTADAGVPIQISRNGTVLVQTQQESGYLMSLPASLLEPPDLSSAPGAVVTQPVEVGGAYAVRQDGAALRSAPSLDAEVLLSLRKDTLVESLGVPVDSGAERWAPVHDSESGTIGYMNMSDLQSTTTGIDGIAIAEAAGDAYAVKWADVELRAAPFFEAPVVLVLQRDSQVVSLGGPVEQGGEQWVPVRDPESARIGYVRLFDLKPSSSS